MTAFTLTPDNGSYKLRSTLTPREFVRLRNCLNELAIDYLGGRCTDSGKKAAREILLLFRQCGIDLVNDE